jgi:hypothetical protein
VTGNAVGGTSRSKMHRAAPQTRPLPVSLSSIPSLSDTVRVALEAVGASGDTAEVALKLARKVVEWPRGRRNLSRRAL